MTALGDGEVDSAEGDKSTGGGVRKATKATKATKEPRAAAADAAAARPDAGRDRETELDTHADLDPEADPDPDADPEEEADAGFDVENDDAHDDAHGDDDEVDEDAYDREFEPEPRPRLTRAGQARRIRAVTSGVVMAAVGVVLVVRLRDTPSLLTVGLYGIALILSGTAIVLSRRGRTRIATAVLGLGFVAVVLAEQMAPDAG